MEQADGGKAGSREAQAASLHIHTTGSFIHGNFSASFWRGEGVGDLTRRQWPRPLIHSCDCLHFAEVLTKRGPSTVLLSSPHRKVLWAPPSLPTYICRLLSNACCPPSLFLSTPTFCHPPDLHLKAHIQASIDCTQTYPSCLSCNAIQCSQVGGSAQRNATRKLQQT